MRDLWGMTAVWVQITQHVQLELTVACIWALADMLEKPGRDTLPSFYHSIKHASPAPAPHATTTKLDLATNIPFLATHLPFLANHLPA